MSTYYNITKQQFDSWIINFATVAAANSAALGLDLTELTEINAARTTFTTSLADQETARAAALGATAQCNARWSAAKSVVGKYNAQIQAIPGISPDLLGELGLSVPGGGGGPVPVFAPSNLSALGCSNGVNSLKWNRNGNESPTVYVVEAAFDGTNDWGFVDNATRDRYDHAGQTPGRFVRYRVYAQRGQTKSNPSGTASVYDPGQSLTLSVAA